MKILPAELPRTAGAYALGHARTKVAFIGYGNNVRHRAHVWAHHLRKMDEDPAHRMPARNFPRHPADEWQFVYTDDVTEEQLRDRFVKAGWTLINPRARKRAERYMIDGIEGSLQEHSRRLGVSYRAVYRRLEKGYSVRQALGIVPPPITQEGNP